jgi:trehalose-6-phosphate synthase
MKKSEMLAVKIGEEVENINTSLGDKEVNKINQLKERLQEKKEALKNRKRVKKD